MPSGRIEKGILSKKCSLCRKVAISMLKDFLYQDEEGGFRLISASTRIGSQVFGPGEVVPVERLIPVSLPSQPFLGQRPLYQDRRRRLAYLFKGIVFLAEDVGAPPRVSYKKLWPVLKMDFPDSFQGIQLKDLVDRILRSRLGYGKGLNPLDPEEEVFSPSLLKRDVLAIDTYLVRADNFFLLRDRAWFADRFWLWSGTLSDGKNFKGTLKKVAGVPKHHDPARDYNHIVRCWIYQIPLPPLEKGERGGYRMLTEERRIRLASAGSAWWNQRAVINEYESATLDGPWGFVRTVKENPLLEPRDYSKRTPIAGLPFNYLPRVMEHYKGSKDSEFKGSRDSVKTNIPLTEIFAQPPELFIEKHGPGYRAYFDRFGVNVIWKSDTGITWSQEATQIRAKDKTGKDVGSFSVIGKRVPPQL